MAWRYSLSGAGQLPSTKRPIAYKGCTIGQSTSYTEVWLGRETRSRLRPLYWIEGAITKPAGQRPFLTTLADTKRYITEELDARHLLRKITP